MQMFRNHIYVNGKLGKNAFPSHMRWIVEHGVTFDMRVDITANLESTTKENDFCNIRKWFNGIYDSVKCTTTDS